MQNEGRGKMNTSINGILRNTFNILTFEKVCHDFTRSYSVINSSEC